MDTDTRKLNMLYDIHQIKQVLFTYATACDYRDWELLEKIFARNVRVNYGNEYKLEGLDAVSGMIRSMLGGCGPSQHLISNFRITVDGDSADCACYVQASHVGIDEKEQDTYEVWAEYRDKLERKESDWIIVERHMHVIQELGTRDVLGPE
jgi:3-phenylpropionate/cinnamic acid dioxygenase small subunit